MLSTSCSGFCLGGSYLGGWDRSKRGVGKVGILIKCPLPTTRLRIKKTIGRGGRARCCLVMSIRSCLVLELSPPFDSNNKFFPSQ